MFLEIQLSIHKYTQSKLLSNWLSHYAVIKNQWRLRQFLNFGRKNNFLGLLIGSGLKLIFHWKAQLFILFKSSCKFSADKSLPNNTEKKDVSSANSLGFETKFSDKSFVCVKKSSDSRIEPRVSPASTLTI